mmetsp:Transcript_53443/g.168212  ORF Transcript_53443/g.168212 Transcript_53443/m.168212 type:complete len:288 (+) Transcript_53443:1013-1876(+)
MSGVRSRSCPRRPVPLRKTCVCCGPSACSPSPGMARTSAMRSTPATQTACSSGILQGRPVLQRSSRMASSCRRGIALRWAAVSAGVSTSRTRSAGQPLQPGAPLPVKATGCCCCSWRSPWAVPLRLARRDVSWRKPRMGAHPCWAGGPWRLTRQTLVSFPMVCMCRSAPWSRSRLLTASGAPRSTTSSRCSAPPRCGFGTLSRSSQLLRATPRCWTPLRLPPTPDHGASPARRPQCSRPGPRPAPERRALASVGNLRGCSCRVHATQSAVREASRTPLPNAHVSDPS